MANISSSASKTRGTATAADAVVGAAERLVDRDGLDRLSMARLAIEVGVRAPSLYKHVDGLEDVRRRLGLLGVRDLAETVRSAVLGRTGDDALSALASAFRGYVRDHPGRYEAQARLALRDDVDYWEAADRAIEAVTAVLTSYGLDGDAARRAVIGFWAAVHGFVELEAAGAIRGYVDADTTFQALVTSFARSFAAGDWARRPVKRRKGRA